MSSGSAVCGIIYWTGCLIYISKKNTVRTLFQYYLFLDLQRTIVNILACFERMSNVENRNKLLTVRTFRCTNVSYNYTTQVFLSYLKFIYPKGSAVAL